MTPLQWYKARSLIILCIFIFFLLYTNLNASWIGLHPPEIDFLRGDIFEFPLDKIEREQEELRLEEEQRREELQQLKDETYIVPPRIQQEFQWPYGDQKC